MNKGYICIFVTAFLFGTMETVLKLYSGLFHPIQITVLRFLVGGLVLLPMATKALKQRGVTLTKDDYKFMAFSGFLGVVVSMIFYQMAVVYGKASVSGVIFSCNSVFVVLFAYFLLGEAITKYDVTSLFFSFAGIVCIADPANIADNALSVFLILMAAVFFALYGIAGRKKSQRFGGIAITCYSFLFGSLEMFVLILLTKLPFIRSAFLSIGLKVFTDIPILEGLTMAHVGPFAYIAVAVTGVGYASYFLAMEYTNPATASLAFYIKPILTSAFAWMVLGEPITLNMIIGICLIVCGSCISMYGKKKTAAVAAK